MTVTPEAFYGNRQSGFVILVVVPVVTRRTTQLNRSKMDRRASHGVREGLLRMRDVLLTYDRLAPVEPQRSMPRCALFIA